MSQHDDNGRVSYENLRVETSEGVTLVTLYRPAKMNALSTDLLEELGAAVAEADHDLDVGAVVITGSTEAKKPAFAAGADIAEMVEMDMLTLREHSRFGQSVLLGIERLTKPAIAAVNGFALGGGLELAMACHLRFAAEGATFGQPEINLGLIPGFGGTQRLVRLVGRGRALEMLLSGEPIGAAEAHRIGLVNRVLPPDDLLPRAMDLARKIAAAAPIAREAILDSVTRGADAPLEQALQVEADLFGMLGATHDTIEGLSAFLEKRKPEWKGC